MSNLTPLERAAVRLAEMDYFPALDFSDPDDWEAQAYLSRAKEVAKVMFDFVEIGKCIKGHSPMVTFNSVPTGANVIMDGVNHITKALQDFLLGDAE
jgi:hypothetical protein